MLGGSVIKVVSCCKINYFGQFSTILEDFDWTNTVGEVKGSFFSWSFPPWWPKSTKSHDLVFENSITGATGARKFFVHVNLPKPISEWSNRISFKEWGLFLTMPPPKKYFWALRWAVSYSCKPLAHKWFVWGRSLLKINQLGNELKEIYVKFQQTWRTEKWIMKGTKWEKCWFWCWLAADLAITALLSDHWENNQIFGNSQNSGWVWKHDTSYKKLKASHIQQTW